ncbi:hypothetical protein [Hymenobacter sp. CRA2]|uniref:hypothetical protein n=1 Tax=Hymenobacter sp. CRA2 TaxID=1955620 RepID=UPI00098F5876|nr:hypothetical protein [Hymenobacter sp. CRA2]OON68760.1 hypothetical protein B0919_11265 [Hymenobacter sp. CRA2]
MKYIMWLCAFFGAFGATAQKRHQVDLASQSLAQPFQAGRITEVLDARPDRTSIGWVQVGIANERVPADIKGGVGPALQRLAQTPAGTDATPYALRVHQLVIGEATGAASEAASAELVVDLLRLQGNGQYEVLWRAAEAVETRGMEVTGKHGANISVLLQKCLAQFEAAGPAKLPAVATLTAEQAAAPLAKLGPLTPFPLQTEKVRRPGVYHSLDDFRRNVPNDQKLVAVSKTPRTSPNWAGTSEVELYYVDDKGARTPVRNVWGFSDGQDSYILHQRRYYLLMPTDEGFMFEAPSAADPGAVGTGAVVGGLIGAGIAAAATSGYRQEHRLNLLTGRVTAVPLKQTEPAFGNDDRESAVVVYRRKPSPSVVDVYAGKNVVGGLDGATGSITIPWTDRRNALKLCGRVGSAAEACVDALPRPGETLYYEWIEEGTSAQLKAVPAKEGAFEQRRAELRTRQKKK